MFQSGCADQYVRIGNGVAVSSSISPQISRSIKYVVSNCKKERLAAKDLETTELGCGVLLFVAAKYLVSGHRGDCDLAVLANVCGSLLHHKRVTLLQQL